MATHRMFPPGKKATASSAWSTTVIGGRTYSAALGSYVSIVVDDDASELEANGWIRAAIHGAGTTAQRPTATNPNLTSPAWYFDTTLGYGIIWDGAAWRNPSTGASV